MRKIIGIFIIIFLVVSCEDSRSFYARDLKGVRNTSLYVKSVEYVKSNPEMAKYGVVGCFSNQEGFSISSKMIYYYDAAGKFNVGDEIVFEKKEHYENEEVDSD